MQQLDEQEYIRSKLFSSDTSMVRRYADLVVGPEAPWWQLIRYELITMLLGGLWHGAALNFILWGAWHGLLLILSRGQSRSGVQGGWLRVIWARVLCFHLITFSWLLFRVDSLDALLVYLRGLAALSGGTALHPAFLAVLLLAAGAHFTPRDWLDARLQRLVRLPVPVQAGGYAALLLLFAGLSLETQPFIYFQF